MAVSFGSGMILVGLRHVGTEAYSRKMLKRSVSTAVSSPAQCFSTCPGTLSGPMALLGLLCCRVRPTSWGLSTSTFGGGPCCVLYHQKTIFLYDGSACRHSGLALSAFVFLLLLVLNCPAFVRQQDLYGRSQLLLFGNNHASVNFDTSSSLPEILRIPRFTVHRCGDTDGGKKENRSGASKPTCALD